MGKSSGKRKKNLGERSMTEVRIRHPKSFDEDTAMFITMARELKEEGNKLCQKRDHEGALLKYEKAIKLLPKHHIDVAYLRSKMAACYTHMGLGEYPRAINECNMALEVNPKYSKALLKRATCYEALNRLDLAYRDVDLVLNMETNNLTALEIAQRVRSALEKKGIMVGENGFSVTPPIKTVKEKIRKKKINKMVEEKNIEDEVVVGENMDHKCVIEENSNKVEENFDQVKDEEEPGRTVKLVLGEDIRWAQLPVHCSIQRLRETIENRYSNLTGFLIKYKDQEGDLITITSTEELTWAESSTEPQNFLKLYIMDAGSGKELSKDNIIENGNAEKGSFYIDDWIIQFARVFKNHIGFNSDACLDLHELGMKLYADAMEDTVTSEEAQNLYEMAEENFQEMAALALFNSGNVHMSKARKKVLFPEDASREIILAQVKTAYEGAQKEFVKAGMRYEEALKIKPDLYEAFLALAQQHFEQARLSWYYAIARQLDMDTFPCTEILQLYNNAEKNMERGMEMWEKMEEQNSNLRSQVNLLWGTILYERSVVEFKLGLPSWEECVEIAVEKFELAGASATDVAVMMKNHGANQTMVEGLGFKIDEIVQAWYEMYDAKRWKRGVPSFRLEPLFRRRVPNLHHVLESM